MHVMLAVSDVVHMCALARARRLTLVAPPRGASWKLALLLVIGSQRGANATECGRLVS